jgi:16S rRNA G966 N2-methylase RsmD
MRFPQSTINEAKEYKTGDYSKFAVVQESAYSSVRPYHFYQIGKILKRTFLRPKLIIDICAHVGCSTVNMCGIYPSVRIISVEIKKSVFNVLCENIKTFKFKSKVTPIHDNGIPFIKKMGSKRITADFVNIDPPWGGPSYTRIKNLMLSLNNTSGTAVPIYDIINDIFARKVSNFSVFKAPINFDIKRFKAAVNGSVKTYPIYNALTKRSKQRKISYFYVVVKFKPAITRSIKPKRSRKKSSKR